MNAEITRKIRLIMGLRKAGIHDTNVLRALETVPREVFVPEMFHDQAYEDRALPIGRGQTISQPYVVAHMTQALRLNDQCKVLEIGTGCGYQAAILAKIARRVYTIERHKPLFQDATQRLEELKVRNIVTFLGDGMKGWPAQSPFDRIIVTAGARDEAPSALVEQIKPGGCMVIPIGSPGDQWLYRINCDEVTHEISYERLFQVRFVPLLPDIARDGEHARGEGADDPNLGASADTMAEVRECVS